MDQIQVFLQDPSLEHALRIGAGVLMIVVLAVSGLGWLSLEGGSRYRFLATVVPVCLALGLVVWAHADWIASGRNPIQFLLLLMTVQCVGAITLLRIFRGEKDKLARGRFGNI